MVNAPPSGAPLESGQRGWGFDSRLDYLGFWILHSLFRTGLSSFFCIFCTFQKHGILCSESFFSVESIDLGKMSRAKGKMK